MKNIKQLFQRCETHSRVSWRRVFEDPRIMVGVFNKMSIMIFGHLCKERCIAAMLVSRTMKRIYRKSGPLFATMYIKQCSSSLQTVYGGSFCKDTTLPVSISLTRSGYPRIIPAYHRRMIQRRDDYADSLVKWYLSIFSVYRTVAQAKRATSGIYDSITKPSSWSYPGVGWLSYTRDSLIDGNWGLGTWIPSRDLLFRYLPEEAGHPFSLFPRWRPTWKATSLSNTLSIPDDVRKKYGLPKRVTSLFPIIHLEYEQFHSLDPKEFFLLTKMVDDPLIYGDTAYYFDQLDDSEVYLDELSPRARWSPFETSESSAQQDVCVNNQDVQVDRVLEEIALHQQIDVAARPVCGRLASLIEGGGKRRIVALGNFFCQTLMRPIHDWLMDLLSGLQTDGTFNQVRPLDRITGKSQYYSFDLKSATDRWPLSFQMLVLLTLAPNLRRAWPLWKGAYLVPRNRRVSFAAGQPMGLLGSWPLFTLSHHTLVWLCAEDVYPGRRFTDYAILGDDIVIADAKVAMCYKVALENLGVTISYQKSMISDIGCAEFAKRFRVRGLKKDLSPISFVDVVMSHHPFVGVGLGIKYNLVSFNQLARVCGYGHRSIHQKNRGRRLLRLQSLYLLRTYNKGLYDLYLSEGRGLNPYMKGKLRFFILDRLKPRDLQPPPEEIMLEDPQWLCEFTVYKDWVTSYLRYYKWWLDLWYSTEDLDLSVLFDGPCYTRSWRRTEENNEIIRFGIFWKAFDMSRQPGLEPLALESRLSGPTMRDMYSLFIDRVILRPVREPSHAFFTWIGDCHGSSETPITANYPCKSFMQFKWTISFGRSSIIGMSPICVTCHQRLKCPDIRLWVKLITGDTK